MPDSFRVGILAGEMSGDILGADLMAEIKKLKPQAEFVGIGGPKMIQQGLDSQVPMDRLSVMGLIEPLKRLPELLRIRKNLYQTLVTSPPDVFIGIDSPDFCLGLEKKIKAQGIPTVHYVSPSVWAWRQKRIKKIKQAVDLMLVLFPHEAKFYEQHQLPVVNVGHPLADMIAEDNDQFIARKSLGLKPDKEVLALLPGSRQGEVERLAPPFLDAAALLKSENAELQIAIPAANQARLEQLHEILTEYPELNVTLIEGQAQQLMVAADKILIASGTATLEALLYKKPMVVCYKMAALSYAIISRMMKIKNFSLPNLLSGKSLVTELVQDDVNGSKLYQELKALGNDNSPKRIEMLEAFNKIHQELKKNASQQAAKAVVGLVCQ